MMLIDIRNHSQLHDFKCDDLFECRLFRYWKMCAIKTTLRNAKIIYCDSRLIFIEEFSINFLITTI